jgi:biopolymer transport protein ExbD
MDEKGFDYMNVIPLVDVMLVLLTIILMTSTFIATGAIPVELPKAARQQSQSPLKSATVVVDARGVVYFDSSPTSLGGLRDRLRVMAKETPFLVRADRTVALQACVDVLDLLSSEGFRKVSLQTETAGRP